jgi:hypothetical protein
MTQETYTEQDPGYHTARIKQMLKNVVDHAREDVHKIDDPRAEALFETTAEVVLGLVKAYDHFEKRSEEAWQE